MSSLGRVALACACAWLAVAVRQRIFPDHSILLVGPPHVRHFSLTGGVKPVNFSEVKINEKALHVPDLNDIAFVLQHVLNSTFREVEVSAVACPDLTRPPYNLTSPGLSGDAKLIEIGGVPFLPPWDRREKLYDLLELAHHLRRESAFVCGAGAGPWPRVGRNSEAAINLKISRGKATQGSRVVWINPLRPYRDVKEYAMGKLPDNETRTALFGSYLITDGSPGQVIKIVAKNRTGSSSFTAAIREALAGYYKDQSIGLGGTFVMLNGTAKLHVMPNFGATPLDVHAGKPEWLRYFEMTAPIVFVGTIITRDVELDLRPEHFHGWSEHGDGGHYHCDSAPAAAHYEGYFVPAHSVIRVDRPQP